MLSLHRHVTITVANKSYKKERRGRSRTEPIKIESLMWFNERYISPSLYIVPTGLNPYNHLTQSRHSPFLAILTST
jgi:hypothetical protein